MIKIGVFYVRSLIHFRSLIHIFFALTMSNKRSCPSEQPEDETLPEAMTLQEMAMARDGYPIGKTIDKLIYHSFEAGTNFDSRNFCTFEMGKEYKNVCSSYATESGQPKDEHEIESGQPESDDESESECGCHVTYHARMGEIALELLNKEWKKRFGETITKEELETMLKEDDEEY